MKSKKLICLAALILFAPAVMASNTLYVDGVSGNDSDTCTSPTTACKTIEHAIALSSSGDSIIVASATYYENLSIGTSLNVIGSGAATTIIDGRCANTVIKIPNTSANVTLSNVTVRNGCARYAGGISNRGVLRIIASTISGNKVGITNTNGSTGGGGIYNYPYAKLTLTSSTLYGNTAKAYCYEGCDAAAERLAKVRG